MNNKARKEEAKKEAILAERRRKKKVLSISLPIIIGMVIGGILAIIGYGLQSTTLLVLGGILAGISLIPGLVILIILWFKHGTGF
ncbi:MAG: hypothetical protein FWE22_06195 [Firmicutes bacterium]|nr:hypothetical protein [Bacillota bacterium]